MVQIFRQNVLLEFTKSYLKIHSIEKARMLEDKIEVVIIFSGVSCNYQAAVQNISNRWYFFLVVKNYRFCVYAKKKVYKVYVIKSINHEVDYFSKSGNDRILFYLKIVNVEPQRQIYSIKAHSDNRVSGKLWVT